MTARLQHIAPGDRSPGDPTPGMVREEAVSTDRLWAGFVRTDPGVVSGWHHHGDYETTVYVAAGEVRMEYGPGGRDHIVAGPGDFLFVPAGAVHRESNPGRDVAEAVVVRGGSGQAVFNVDGPDAAG